MIVRIMTEDQYRLDDERMPEVQRLDEALDAAMDHDDTAAFQTALQQLINYVRQHGQTVEMSEVLPSDLIIPAPDMTLSEARDRIQAQEAAQRIEP